MSAWDYQAICQAAAVGLRAEAERLDQEQSPYGVDALDELALHGRVQAGLRDAGFGVHPEQRYPADRSRPKRSEGDRCDLVLTPKPDDHLLDPLAADTLFAGRGCPPRDALWIEVKVVRQYALVDGAIVASKAYASQLLGGATADVRRLAGDPAVEHAAAMVTFFIEDEATARHDVEAWLKRCLDRDLPVCWPQCEAFPISDRLGNRICLVSLARVRTLSD